MGSVANRRAVTTLFSAPACAESHRARIVLAEKDIQADVIQIDPDDKPEDLADLNPYNSVPTLVDRDIVLYEARVITEYLDERFPHPPLMPVDPVSRAHARLALYRIERDWYGELAVLESSDAEEASAAAGRLRESVLTSSAIFEASPFFLSGAFSLVDCAVAPVLWRLPRYGIELPRSAAGALRYAERVFSRPSFQASLSEAERRMR